MEEREGKGGSPRDKSTIPKGGCQRERKKEKGEDKKNDAVEGRKVIPKGLKKPLLGGE